ncbi:tocopherol cyclase family protein [Facklamia sp. 7083-14-GEN3]|uniref:tocopherol cyclase family protein n=1 Tax=Facklamia sp. 7083-14-GEN3 TaxID=2973478 RepID=UPI00215CFCA8|nr:tocopherol cyclase family protein [Facklamia sp. 7083-14-GEN3]MCR8968404.1 tocopherol cyclase family protein [Facklamia sp. 7083-14-GEN3]
MYKIGKLFNPELFQGKKKTKNYFEGWYYKLVTHDKSQSLALIPGIAYNKEGEGHAFIQLIDSIHYQTEYYRFPISDFKYSEKELDISISKSNFQQNQIQIDLSDQPFPIEGHLTFDEIDSFPKTFLRPGIMGPFSFVPFMECYHGVVNIHHRISGHLRLNNQVIDFTDGYGYIEKDWGRSFPDWYVWLQSNHFSQEKTSLMFSIAKIPWLGKHFTGFLTFLNHQNQFYLLATYTGAKVKQLNYQAGDIEIEVEDKRYRLLIKGQYDQGGILKAPKNGLMARKISESISSVVHVTLFDKKGNILFEDQGKNAGLEVVGKQLNG